MNHLFLIVKVFIHALSLSPVLSTSSQYIDPKQDCLGQCFYRLQTFIFASGVWQRWVASQSTRYPQTPGLCLGGAFSQSGVFGLTLCEGERGVTYTKKLLLAPGSLANGYKSSECSTHCSNVCVDYLRFFSDDFLKVTWHFQGARLWGECIVCIALLFPTVRHCWCLWFQRC